MDSFSTVDRVYRFRGGAFPGKKAPSTTKQHDGFKPTYIDIEGNFVQGDQVDSAELNYIFNDLYGKAAKIDQLLTAKGK